MISDYNDSIFRSRVDTCLEKTKQVLHATKRLTTPELMGHRYTDKYLIADYLGNAAIICYLNCLTKLGLSKEDLSILVSWARSRDISLRLTVDEKCVFIKEIKRDVENPTRQQTEVIGMSGFGLMTSKSITTITENVYEFKSHYELIAYRGVGDKIDDRIILQSRSSQQSIVIASKSSPYPEASNKHFDCNISWLLRCVDDQSMQVALTIDRDHDDCHTPARNKQVSSALDFYRRYKQWSEIVTNYFESDLFRVQRNYSVSHMNMDCSAINTEGILVPVVPLVCEDGSTEKEEGIHSNEIQSNEGGKEGKGGIGSESISVVSMMVVDKVDKVDNKSSVTLSGAVVSQLLTEQARSLEEKCEKLSNIFSPSTTTDIITVAEAKLLIVLLHMKDIAVHYGESIQFLENMIRTQLVSAVGKVLTANHFAEYMRYHNRKLFKDGYQPRPFSHAVRRTSDHSPEGSIRIEEHPVSGSLSEPIFTSCYSRTASQAAPMQFALNASTNVTFGGDRHLHTWMAHSFSNEPIARIKLVAQARQFSSFIVLIGQIASATIFEPKYGMIVQNKDEVTIPLHLEQIPTPKEFRDSIESLSPEQQRFAKAFRGMQLESTLFGVLILQIKPQLEKLLKLNTDSLTKEIRLTQDLMELFIKYQIPSDLLSFDEDSVDCVDVSQDIRGNIKRGMADLIRGGGGGGMGGGVRVISPLIRLGGVKDNVQRMQDMISDSKAKEIADKAEVAIYENPLTASYYEDCAPYENVCDEYPIQQEQSNNYRKKSQSRGGGMFGGSMSVSSAVSKMSAPSPSMSTMRCETMSAPPVCALISRCDNLPSVPKMHSKSSQPSQQIVNPRNRKKEVARDKSAVTTTSTGKGAAPTRQQSQSTEGGKPTTQNNQINQNNQNEKYEGDIDVISMGAREIVDFTKYPSLLDRRCEELDPDSALRPTIIHAGEEWEKKSYKSLMSEGVSTTVGVSDLSSEKNAAFELLDALSRSGALLMESASLHVVIAATHCFDKSLMDTVVQGNVNPIERVERSALIMASTIHGLPVSELVSESELQRVLTYSPQLEIESP